MSISATAIDRLFNRFGIIYGNQWVNMWVGMSINDVKTLWMNELAGFGDKLEMIAWALEHLPERPPNLIQFKNLCSSAPRANEYQKIEFKGVPVPLELADKLKNLKKPENHDYKDWAKKILARHRAGEPVRLISLQFAKQALRES
jgi:hypothetical protein